MITHHIAAGLAILALGHHAPVQKLTVVPETYVNPTVLTHVEHALEDQAVQLRARWDTPLIRFGRGGWPVYLVANSNCLSNSYGNDTWGIHLAAPHPSHNPCMHPSACSWTQQFAGDCQQTPFAIVDTLGAFSQNTDLMSHEVMEMLVDPHGTGEEVCDPVADDYTLDGVQVQDFVFPDWFSGKHRKHYDQMGLTNHPGETQT